MGTDRAGGYEGYSVTGRPPGVLTDEVQGLVETRVTGELREVSPLKRLGYHRVFTNRWLGGQVPGWG